VCASREPRNQFIDCSSWLPHVDNKVERSNFRPRAAPTELLRDAPGVPSLPVPRSPLRLIGLAAPLALLAAVVLLPAAAHGKVRAEVSGALLVVSGGKGDDRVKVSCVGGLVKVNAKNPRTGPVECSRISEVDALTGSGNDRVDLSGVGPGTGFGQRDLPGGFGHGTGAAADLGDGQDRYIGGASAFNLVLAGPGDDTMAGGRVRDSLQGGGGNDRATGGAGRDILLGNAGSDRLNAGADDDLISGNAGNDLLTGGAGADLLGGGAGMDRLVGGPGPDQLIGGAGKDRLDGGPGNNTLVQDAPKK
jgi:RTX calcium-binding nonapeptide repeat (4 copies)